MSGQSVFSALSFAAAGLLAGVRSEEQSSTSASLARLRSAHEQSSPPEARLDLQTSKVHKNFNTRQDRLAIGART